MKPLRLSLAVPLLLASAAQAQELFPVAPLTSQAVFSCQLLQVNGATALTGGVFLI